MTHNIKISSKHGLVTKNQNHKKVQRIYGYVNQDRIQIVVMVLQWLVLLIK